MKIQLDFIRPTADQRAMALELYTQEPIEVPLSHLVVHSKSEILDALKTGEELPGYQFNLILFQKQWVGFTELFGDPNQGQCALNIRIPRSLRRQGFGEAALRASVSKLFENNPKLVRIEINVTPDNVAAIRMLLGCGFRNEGISVAALSTADGFSDLIRFSLIHPGLSPNALGSHHIESAVSPEDELRRLEEQAAGLFKMEHPLLERLGVLPLLLQARSVLDVGCGAGHYFPFLRSLCPDAKLFGVDSSDRAIKNARNTFGDFGRFEVSDALGYLNAQRDESFDVINMHFVAGHLPARLLPSVLTACLRCLKPQGIFLSTYSDERYFANYPRLPLAELIWQHKAWNHVSLGSSWGILSSLGPLLAEAGFGSVRCEMKYITPAE